MRAQVRRGKIPATKREHRTVDVRRVDIEALLPRERGAVWDAPVKLRKMSSAELGSWLLEVIEGEESPEENLATIRVFTQGLPWSEKSVPSGGRQNAQVTQEVHVRRKGRRVSLTGNVRELRKQAAKLTS